jgi:glyoxylase-like metal-dependent hydrolase (beta-lactamase superfamily II)
MTEFDPAHVSPGGPPHRYRHHGDGPAVTKLSVGSLDNNAYLLADSGSGEAVLVDAAAEAERLLALLEGWTLTGVVTTHRHADHSGALAAVLRASGAWSGAHAADAAALPVAPDRLLGHGDVVQVGPWPLTVLHTPGHTDGSICLVVPRGGAAAQVLTGDALFPGGVGRTSGPAAFRQAVDSVERHVFTLPPDTRISPGHGDDTLVGTEEPELPAWRARGW